ncbi:MAG: cation transporter [Clostridia bacterium]|nr:cation transporter [Clostridia bacterium]
MTKLLMRLFIKDYNNTLDITVRRHYGTLASFVGIFCNVILSGFKIAAGAISGSISIIADGLNNLSDMGSSVITMIGFRISNKPADKDHPYGHGRMEYMSAFIVAVLILFVGIELLKESVGSIFNGTPQPVYPLISVIILAVSALIKLWLFFFNKSFSKKIESQVLLATAQDSFNDFLGTTAILIGVLISKFFVLPFNLDAIMGMGVALFILYSGFNLARETVNIILGEPPKPEKVSEIENTIFSFEEFLGVHDLIVHNYGPGREFASVHVEVPENTDIVKCHEKIDLCEKLVKEKLGIELVIHMDPIETNNEIVNSTKASILSELKKIHPNITIHDFRMTPKSENRTNFIFDTVVPADLKLTEQELKQRIDQIVKNIDNTYYCVITFDNDFTGK